MFSVFTIILFVVLSLTIWYSRFFHSEILPKWAFPTAYLIKVFTGVLFIYIYSEHYGSGTLSEDAGVYMRESSMLRDVFYTSPWDYLKLLFGLDNSKEFVQHYLGNTTHWDMGHISLMNDNRNLLRIHSLIYFISNGNPIIHVQFFCFLSMIGQYHLFQGLKSCTSLKPIYLFSILLFFPSLLFWSSGILKEPFILLSIGFFVRGIFGNDSKRKKIFFFITGSILLLSFKQYIALSVVPAAIFFTGYKYLPRYKIAGSLLILGFTIILPVLILSETRTKVVHFISRRQYDFNNIAKGGMYAYQGSPTYYFSPEVVEELPFEKDSFLLDHPVEALHIKIGDLANPVPLTLYPSDEYFVVFYNNKPSNGHIKVTLINDSFLQMIYNIPEALINSLLRPYFSDPGGRLKYPAALETLLIFGFLGFSIIRRKKITKNNLALIIAVAIFILVLSLFIGWTTPVVGAIARYRIPAYLGILIISFILIRPPKFFSNEHN